MLKQSYEPRKDKIKTQNVTKRITFTTFQS